MKMPPSLELYPTDAKLGLTELGLASTEQNAPCGQAL
jgi:hypothetical protein